MIAPPLAASAVGEPKMASFDRIAVPPVMATRLLVMFPSSVERSRVIVLAPADGPTLTPFVLARMMVFSIRTWAPLAPAGSPRGARAAEAVNPAVLDRQDAAAAHLDAVDRVRAGSRPVDVEPF